MRIGGEVKDLLIAAPLMDTGKFRQPYVRPVPGAPQKYTTKELADAFGLEEIKLGRFIGVLSNYSNKDELIGHLQKLCGC